MHYKDKKVSRIIPNLYFFKPVSEAEGAALNDDFKILTLAIV